MRSLVVLGILAAAATLVPACGGDSESGAAATTPFTVWAFEELTTGADDTPLANAEVAFDPPGGGPRVLRRTEPDGHVTFEGDFTRGATGSVTVFEADHVLVSAVQASPDTARVRGNVVGKPASDLVLFAPRLDDAVRRSTVEVRGAVLSRRDASSSVDLAASALKRLGSVVTNGATYVLRAPRDRAFFILAHETKSLSNEPGNVETEHVGSFRVDVPALTTDTTVDVDLARAMRLVTAAVRLRAELPVAPSGARSPFGVGSRASATVISADSTLLVAPIRSAKATADGRAFDLEMSVAQTDVSPDRPLTRVALVAADGSRAVRVEPGVAADGATWNDFPFPPFVAEASRSLAEPLPLDDVPEGADLAVEVYAGTQLAWIITGPPGGLRERSVVVPSPLEIRLPALVAVSIIARMDRVVLPPRGEIFRRVAISRDVLFRR